MWQLQCRLGRSLGTQPRYMQEPRLATLICALVLLLLNRYNLIPRVIREHNVKPILVLLQSVFSGHTDFGSTRTSPSTLSLRAIDAWVWRMLGEQCWSAPAGTSGEEFV